MKGFRADAVTGPSTNQNKEQTFDVVSNWLKFDTHVSNLCRQSSVSKALDDTAHDCPHDSLRKFFSVLWQKCFFSLEIRKLNEKNLVAFK